MRVAANGAPGIHTGRLSNWFIKYVKSSVCHTRVITRYDLTWKCYDILHPIHEKLNGKILQTCFSFCLIYFQIFKVSRFWPLHPTHTYTVPDQRFFGSDAILGKLAFKFTNKRWTLET